MERAGARGKETRIAIGRPVLQGAWAFLLLSISVAFLTSCLEVERARVCNRIGAELHAVFPGPNPLKSPREAESLAQAIEALDQSLVHQKLDGLPGLPELQALQKELRHTSAELKRWEKTPDSPLAFAQKKRLSDAIHRLTEAAKAFASACH